MLISILEFALRLGMALGLGAAIGLERQIRQSSAGLRTNTLVSLGAAGYVLLSESLTASQGDPSRVVGQIVTGIGFLGGGVILKEGVNVRGLNTAATIWCSAAVGALTASGLFAQAVLMTAAIMLTHTVLRPVGNWINIWRAGRSDSNFFYYELEVHCLYSVENTVRLLCLNFLKADDRLRLVSIFAADKTEADQVLVRVEIEAQSRSENALETLTGSLKSLEGVLAVLWKPIVKLNSEY
jgi:putative Mg2+ transporter-C (MgtC) family protein